MNDKKLETIEQIRRLKGGSQVLEFTGISIEERYSWIEAVFLKFGI